MKHCSRCASTKPLTEFGRSKDTKDGLGYYCLECCRSLGRENHLKFSRSTQYLRKKKDTRIRSRYGITLDGYLAKLAEQGSQCAICSESLPQEGPKTHLDHDHRNGKLRDFLCTNCNRGLGHFKDSPEILVLAASYLRRHSAYNTID